MSALRPGLVAIALVAACGSVSPRPAAPPAGVEHLAAELPGDVEGWFRYEDVEIETNPLPARFTAALPVEADAVQQMLFGSLFWLPRGEKSVVSEYPPYEVVARELQAWSPAMLERLRAVVTALDHGSGADREAVVELYQQVLQRALNEVDDRVLCDRLRPLMSPDEPLAVLLLQEFLECAQVADVPTLQALPLTDSQRGALDDVFPQTSVYLPSREAKLATLAAAMTASPTSTAFYELYQELPRHVRSGDARAIERWFASVPDLAARTATTSSDPAQAAQMLSMITDHVASNVPDGQASTLYRQKCKAKPNAGSAACTPEALSVLGTSIRAAIERAAWRSQQLAEPPEPPDPVVCDGPLDGPSACLKASLVLAGLREAGLVGPDLELPEGSHTRFGALLAGGTAFELKEADHRWRDDTAELLPRILALLAEPLADAESLTEVDPSVEGIPGQPPAVMELQVFVAGRHARRRAVGNPWRIAETIVGLLNSVARELGTPWRLLIVEGGSQFRVVAGPAAALSEAVRRDWIRPYRGAYERALEE